MKSFISFKSFIFLVFILMLLYGCKFSSTSSNTQTSYFTPYGQKLTPAGVLLRYGNPDIEQHAMDCKLSPDDNTLAVEGRFTLVLVNTKEKKIKKEISLNFKKHQGSMYTGITWSRDGKIIYWSISDGRILEAKLNGDDVTIRDFFKFDDVNGHPALPNDIKISPDGKFMYITLNGGNKVVKLRIKNKEIVWETSVGEFPYALTLAKNKVYVTNWGGRIPTIKDFVEQAGWNNIEKNEIIVANPKTESAASGTVTVLDDYSGNVIKTINVGLHPNSIIANKDGSRVYVANANSDTVSVINTSTDTVVENIIISPNKLPFGCSPDALVISHDGKYLYVADGMINAVAVVELGEDSTNIYSGLPKSKIIGFIPTGAYPGGLDISKDDKILFVANTEGLLSTATTTNPNDKDFQMFYNNIEGEKLSTAGMYNSHRQYGYISIIDIPKNPDEDDLEEYTNTVMDNIQYEKVLHSLKLLTLPARKDVAPVPIPARLGEPSVFKHVIYIIKENRSYDQVLGDMPEGNGDPNLTVFGESVTPNQHKIARNFLLMDNFYVEGKCSAEGHPWVDAAFTTDYIEKNVRGWFRGYPHVILDAMVTPKTGYIWDDVLNHGKTFCNYGEDIEAILPDNITWSDVYQDYLTDTPLELKNEGTLKNLLKYTNMKYPGYDHHKILDVLRAKEFINELQNYTDKTFPNLVIISLPADHTAGLKYGYPTPQAMVADNDLALGQIVDAVSHSPIWKDTVIFVTEDDSQDGWDHVSAYRSVGFVISPYSRLHKTIHTFYSQLSIIRTIEQILGIPPMNLMDLCAPLMYECFTNTADFTPYDYVENQVPLDTMNPSPDELTGLAKYWSKIAQRMSMKLDDPDNDEILNRMIWYSAKGYNTPYPIKYTDPNAKDMDDD